VPAGLYRAVTVRERFGLCLLTFLPLLCPAAQTPPSPQSASAVITALQQLTIDPAQTYRVRELQIARGDLKIYLTEGILAFSTPIAGRPVAAVFTTGLSEGGDGEVLVLPPQRSERAAMAAFSKSPNLDEHFDSAVFFFSDDTVKELQAQIQERPVHTVVPEFLPQISEIANKVLRNSSDLNVRVTQSVLDSHRPSNGFFYGRLGGRSLGVFEVVYEPDRFEPITVGRMVTAPNSQPHFQIWSSFRSRGAPVFVAGVPSIHAYRLETTINADLSLSCTAQFDYQAEADDGRVIALELSSRMRVIGASIDGAPAEVLQQQYEDDPARKGSAVLLLIAPSPLAPGGKHQVEVRYQGSVIRQTNSGEYFVDERNSWYPFIDPTLAIFDMTFHCPENLRLASTGEPVSETVEGGIRTTHRTTEIPEAFAGFNLGAYTVSTADAGPYRIEFFANRGGRSLADLSTQTANILDYYTKRWIPLHTRSLAVTPIEGYFGQGFPGLIYLSNVSYIREEDRPINLRNPRLDAFFSDMLLPHEIAHQWWGNVITQANYRTAWLMEAMPNYSALEFLEDAKRISARDVILDSYRRDLTTKNDLLPSESAGPVDFGTRVLNNSGVSAWQMIVYEKGTWILHMLRQRLGPEAFRTLQLHMLQQYAAKPITNEDFRRLAAELLPGETPDRDLNLFFDAWIYGTGIPKLKLNHQRGTTILTMSGVENDFLVDVPLRCQTPVGSQATFWVRASPGDNLLELPRGLKTCALPLPNQFLYSLAE
jgi:hypothetical protein